MRIESFRNWVVVGVAACVCVSEASAQFVPDVGGGYNTGGSISEGIARIDPGPYSPGFGESCGIGNPNEYIAGISPTSPNPVDLISGNKIESAVDLVVRLAGMPYVVSRQYSSDPGYSISPILGNRWALSTMRTLRVEWMDNDGSSADCLHMLAGGIPKAAIATTWCSGASPCTAIDSASGLKIDGPTDQFLKRATIEVDSDEYPTWRIVQPGAWQIDFFRGVIDDEQECFEADDDWELLEEPAAGDIGMVAQVSDSYGNRHVYTYETRNSVRVVSEVNCYTSDDQHQAKIVFNYASSGGPSLESVEVQRPNVGSSGWIPTQRVYYTRLADNSSPHLGKTGDLVQVRVDERVDPAPGASASEAVWRSQITQYRYHVGGSAEVSDADTDGYEEEWGDEHQLKMVINPQQVEFYAEAKAQSLSETDESVITYADDLMALEDGDIDAGLSPVTLAAKVISNYIESGTYEGRVATQYLLSGCGCAVSGAQGMKEDFEYLAYSGGFTTKTTQSMYDSSWVNFRTRYADMAQIPTSPSHAQGIYGGAWMLVNDVTTDPNQSGKYWVTHYQYSTDNLATMDRKYMPSAMATSGGYTLAVAGSPGTAPTYTPKSTAGGLIHAFGYDSLARRTEVRVRDQVPSSDVIGSYWLIEKTTYGSGDESHLPVMIQRIRTEQQTSVPGTADDVETVEFDYAFHSGSNLGIAWVKTTVEAETITENGPGGTYDSWEMYDQRGLNYWSVGADGALTKRVFDNDETPPESVSRTGAVIQVVQNADSVNDAFPSPAGGVVPTVPSDRNSEANSGEAGQQSLTNTWRLDVLGRVQEAVGAGGRTTYWTREMRSSVDRPGLTYYAEVSLPHQFSGTSFDGPMFISWKDAGGKTFESRGYKPGGSYSIVTSPDAYRMVVGSYSTSTLLARSGATLHVSGMVEETRQWHDPSDSNGYYQTEYRYDPLGRVSVVTGPMNQAGTDGTSVKTEYDFLNRPKIRSVSNDPDTGYVEIERLYYDSQVSGGSEVEGPGNGWLTYVLRKVNGDPTDDRATRYGYDYRGNRTSTLSPAAPHFVAVFDNLGRSVRSADLAGSTASTTWSTSDANRASLTQTTYSQRGVPIRTEVAIDPTVALGSASFVSSERWLDPVGREVGSWSPGSPMTKSTYDGLGRQTAAYLTDRGGDANPRVGSYAGKYATDVHVSNASVLSDDHVIEQTEIRYVTASNVAKGLPDLATVRRRASDDSSGTGSLGSSSTAVVSFQGSFYDAAGRLVAQVDYGTRATYFMAGGSAPTVTQGSVPTASATELVTTMAFDDRGLVKSVTDSGGAVEKNFYDGLNRRFGTISNASANSAIVWDGTLGRWKGSSFSATPGFDQAISSVFNARGQVVKYVAHVGDTGTGDQVTSYTYGVSSSTTPTSDLASNDLMLCAEYPGDGLAADRTVHFAYNRLGERRYMEDQNGTVHSYAYDKLGRVVLDDVGTFGGGIDDQIDRIVRAFDGAGRLSYVRSLAKDCEYDFEDPDDPASLDCVLNEVRFEYTPMGQVEKVWQNTALPPSFSESGAVEISSGQPQGTTRLVKYAYSNSPVTATSGVPNYSRLDSVDYPRNSNSGGTPITAGLDYVYETGINDAISRVTRLDLDGVTQVKYGIAGADVYTLVNYHDIGVQLDRSLNSAGERRFGSHTSQDSGDYPSLDRFGRVLRQDWVDSDLHSVTNPYPPTSYKGPDRPQIVALGYAYDTAGNRTRMVDNRRSSTWKHSFVYAHDGLDRLVAADRGIWSGSALGTVKGSEDWDLDLLGNWTEWKQDWNYSGSFDDEEDQERTHNAANELKEIEVQTLPLQFTDLAYDQAGNLASVDNGFTETTYVHDAWNRLVKVDFAVGESTGSSLWQQHNGLNWRTWKYGDTAPPSYYTEIEEEEVLVTDPPDGELDDLHVFTYDADWRILEDRITTSHASLDNRLVQYMWGQRYVDDCVLHRVDVNMDGDYVDLDGDVDEGVYHHLADAMFSTVALMQGSVVVERITYDPYGKPLRHAGSDLTGDGFTTTADTAVITGTAWGSFLGGSGSYNSLADIDRDGDVDSTDLGVHLSIFEADSYPSALSSRDNLIGFDGYVHDQEFVAYTVRHRTHEPQLGRWVQRDPLGYAGASNLYESVLGNPSLLSDWSGLLAGHAHASGGTTGNGPPGWHPPLLPPEDPVQQPGQQTPTQVPVVVPPVTIPPGTLPGQTEPIVIPQRTIPVEVPPSAPGSPPPIILPVVIPVVVPAPAGPTYDPVTCIVACAACAACPFEIPTGPVGWIGCIGGCAVCAICIYDYGDWETPIKHPQPKYHQNPGHGAPTWYPPGCPRPRGPIPPGVWDPGSRTYSGVR